MALREQIQEVLERSRLAVLATHGSGQPHASLVAFTPTGGVRHLIFATHRDTRKYRNILADPRVAVLIGARDDFGSRPDRRLVLTALGEATEIPEVERPAALSAHAARHPDLQEFFRSTDCALLRVSVQAYQVVAGFDDVQWYQVQDPPSAGRADH